LRQEQKKSTPVLTIFKLTIEYNKNTQLKKIGLIMKRIIKFAVFSLVTLGAGLVQSNGIQMYSFSENANSSMTQDGSKTIKETVKTSIKDGVKTIVTTKEESDGTNKVITQNTKTENIQKPEGPVMVDTEMDTNSCHCCKKALKKALKREAKTEDETEDETQAETEDETQDEREAKPSHQSPIQTNQANLPQAQTNRNLALSKAIQNLVNLDFKSLFQPAF